MLPLFTYTHTHKQLAKWLFYICVCVRVSWYSVVWKTDLGCKFLNWVLTIISKTYSSPNFITNLIFNCYCYSQELTFWKFHMIYYIQLCYNITANVDFVSQSCIYFYLYLFLHKIPSFAWKKIPELFFTTFILSPNKLTFISMNNNLA
jgi:hypothetical protein